MEIIKTAHISTCQKYRYTLTRTWDPALPKAVLIGLNPSTADANKDDPTIRKIISLCQRWGLGGFTMLNLFAYRATDPKELKGLLRTSNSIFKVIGPSNECALETNIGAMGPKDILVFVWGAIANDVSQYWTETIYQRYWKQAHYLKLNRDNSPAHPLYLANSIKPVKYR